MSDLGQFPDKILGQVINLRPVITVGSRIWIWLVWENAWPETRLRLQSDPTRLGGGAREPATTKGHRYINQAGTFNTAVWDYLANAFWIVRLTLLVFICIDEVLVGVTVPIWLCWSKCVWSFICTVIFIQELTKEYSLTDTISVLALIVKSPLTLLFLLF